MSSETAAQFATVVSAFAALLTFGVTLGAAIFARRQILELSQSRSLSAFIAILDHLQDERVREARRILIGLKGKKIDSWTPDEIREADLALRSYNTVAIMIDAGTMPPAMEKAVIDEWGASILRCWEAGQPLVEKYRAERRDHSYWPRLQTLRNKVAASRGQVLPRPESGSESRT